MGTATSKYSLSLVLLLGLTACGDVVPSKDRWATGVQPSKFAYTTDALSDENFFCADEPNVLENYDDDLKETGRYTVCTARASAYQVRVHGHTYDSDSVCVFPARYVDRTHIVASLDSHGYPLVACASIAASASGLIYQFDNVSFNYAFIVEEAYKDQMQMCLFSQNPSMCPERYSKGKFR